MKTKTPQDYLNEPYTFQLIKDDDGTYAAWVLEFDGCFSQGDTADEAMENITEAAGNWIEATLRNGKLIPPPVALNEASGKFALRMPKNMHQKVQQMARVDGVSVNSFLIEAIAEKIGAIEYQDRHMERLERKLAERTVANIASMLLPQFRFTQNDIRTAATSKSPSAFDNNIFITVNK